jgi:ATP-binding cassette, subfamily B, bacterial
MKPLLFIWQLIRYRPWLYLCNGIVWITISISPLIPGLIAREFFNSLTGIAHFDRGTWGVIALLLITMLARVALIYVGAITDTIHRFSMSALVRRNLLQHIFQRPGAEILSESSGEILNRFRDDASTVEDLISNILDLIGKAIFAVVAVGILLSINTYITLLVFIPLVFVIVIANIAQARVLQSRKASRQATGRVSEAIGEMFGMVQAIQVASAQSHAIEHLRNLSDQRRAMILRDRLFTQILSSIFANTVNLGTGLILLLSAQSMQAGTFSVGDFTVFVYYLAFVTDFTQFFGGFLAYTKQASISIDRLNALLHNATPNTLVEHNPVYLTGKLPMIPNLTKSTADCLECLEVVNLTYHYPGSRRGISNVDMKIKRGSFIVITGPTGSGKTTLLRALLGLLPKTAGDVCWNGQIVTDLASFFIPPRCAYTAQVPLLFSGTMKENLLLGRPEQHFNLDRAIHSAVLESDLARMEDSLETVIGVRGVKLSGGQIQRLAAARMFVSDAELLVFDDLSSALDVETEHILWERLFERTDVTCLVVSHRREALRRADHIIMLDNGKVITQGSLEQLLIESQEMRWLWNGGLSKQDQPVE